MAPAFGDEILAVPLRKRLHVLERAHDAKRHEAEIGRLGLCVLFGREGVRVALGVDALAELVVVRLLAAELVAVGVDLEEYLVARLASPSRPLGASLLVEPIALETAARLAALRLGPFGDEKVAGDRPRPVAVDVELVYRYAMGGLHFLARRLERNGREKLLLLGPPLIKVLRLGREPADLVDVNASAAVKEHFLQEPLPVRRTGGGLVAHDLLAVGIDDIRLKPHKAGDAELRRHLAEFARLERHLAGLYLAVVAGALPVDHVAGILELGRDLGRDEREYDLLAGLVPHRIVLVGAPLDEHSIPGVCEDYGRGKRRGQHYGNFLHVLNYTTTCAAGQIAEVCLRGATGPLARDSSACGESTRRLHARLRPLKASR